MNNSENPKLSVVIALYNQEKEIKICLESIFRSDWRDFEVLIIDDCSTDNSAAIAGKFPVRVISTGTNSGPAKARNMGVREAKSDIIQFLDADTEVEKDSLRKIYESFIKLPEIWGVIALSRIRSLRPGLAPDYNALKNNYTLYSARQPYCNYFTTQMGAIRKKIFNQLGGFDENFTGADVEDIEFGMRIPKGKIFIQKDVEIGHHFPSFKVILKKYFKRAIMLSELFKNRRKFCSVHASVEAFFSVLIVLVSFTLFLFFWIHEIVLILFIVSIFAFLLMNLKMWKFFISKRGILYLFPAIFFEYIFSVVVGLGGFVGTMQGPFRKTKEFFSKYFNLLRIFISRKPAYLIFYVTAVCNSRCKMCFNWKYNTQEKQKDELTLEEIEKMSLKMGYLQYVTLGGGEPFLRQDLPEICRIFYRNNHARIFSIPTNCLTPDLIAEKTEKMIKNCPEAIFRVSMSIDGLDELHDEIRGVRGNFEKVKETYRHLYRLREKYPNLEMIANTTFTSYNQDKINEIHDWIRHNFKIDMPGLTLVRGDSRESVSHKIDIEKYKKAVEEFEQRYFENKGQRRHPLQRLMTILPIFTRREVIKNYNTKPEGRTYECHSIKKYVVIDSFGNVYACEMLPDKLGNLKQESYDLAKILSKSSTKELLHHIKDKRCNCTWECAIQNSLVYNYKKYPAMIYEAFLKK